jgi:Acetyltransferase (GNAT) domain
MRNVSMAVRREDRIVGIFPLVSIKAFGLSYGVALPHCSGGPLYDDVSDFALALKSSRRRCNVVEIHSYNKLPIEHEVRIPHLLVQLSKDTDAVRKRYAKNVRSALHKSKRTGIRVRASSLESDIDAFYEIYESTVLAQAGPSRLSKAHIRNVFKFLQPNQRILLVAERDGVIIGGLIGLFHLKDAYYWAAASKRGYNASELLLDELIQRSCENHERLFLGGGRYGVKDTLFFFKSRWGGTDIPAFRYRLVSGIRGRTATSLTRFASWFPQLREQAFESKPSSEGEIRQ